MRERYRLRRQRETKFLMSFDVSKLNRRLLALLTTFIVLNFLDSITTLVAIRTGPSFVELNPIAAFFFRRSFLGFLAALLLKYLPMVPLAYATFVGESPSRPLAIRIVKVGAFVALIAADVFYLAVVGSNLRTLVAYFIPGA